MTIPRWYLLIPVVLGLLCAAGCVSTEESEMPWNAPALGGNPGHPRAIPHRSVNDYFSPWATMDSAIWMAFWAAPFQMLSPAHQRTNPFSAL